MNHHICYTCWKQKAEPPSAGQYGETCCWCGCGPAFMVIGTLPGTHCYDVHMSDVA